MDASVIVVVGAMLSVGITFYVIDDVSAGLCAYLMWVFVAAALVQRPEPSLPEPAPLSELKLRWRGHLK